MKLSPLCRLICLRAFNYRKTILSSTKNNVQQSFSNTSSTEIVKDVPGQKEAAKTVEISKAMRAYLQRSVEHEKFISEKTIEYEIGKRHLANMMGENPETFSQEDIDQALAYLLPSGLYEPKARPLMKHPTEIFPKRKAAEFDETGRPFHTLFYTGRPSFYSLLQDLSIKSQQMDQLLDKMKGSSIQQETNFDGSKWILKHAFENIILEPLPDYLYEYFIQSMERLMSHRLAYREKEFIMKFRQEILSEKTVEEIPELMYTPTEVPYMTAKGLRKTSTAEVTVYGQGSGKFSVNGQNIIYFKSLQDRQQVMFPLQLTGLMMSVDVEATIEGGGSSGQAGALRYGISLALRSFVSINVLEKMRIAGLLTRDARKKERQKPGQRGARAKYTWKKR